MQACASHLLAVEHRSRAFPKWLVCLALLAVAPSCGSSAVEPDDPCAAALAIRQSIPGGASFLSIAEEADVAARVIAGGFGGLFQDLERGRLVISLKDLAQAGEAESELRQLLACGGAYPGWEGTLVNSLSLESRSGLHSGTEILNYYAALSFLLTDPEVWGMEVDPEANRIWIGLTSMGAQTRVALAITAASVPPTAVILESPPPAPSDPAFEVLTEDPVDVQSFAGVQGVFGFPVQVRYTNRHAETRYPDRCVSPFSDSFYAYFLFTLTRWSGSEWVPVHQPTCGAVLLAPRAVQPGETTTDSVPVAGSRRSNSMPHWNVARVTGTYRFVGVVYLTPPLSPPFSNLAPESERVSAPFRIRGPNTVVYGVP